MTINFMLNQLRDIIKYLPSNLGVYQESDEFDMEWELSDDAEKVIGNCHVNHGASKCVIISDFCDYVIKIPFNGMWIPQIDEETDEYLDDEFVEFTQSEGLSNNWDYCAVEEEEYQNIVRDGFEKYFAETKFAYVEGNTPVYIQEKVYGIWDENIEKTTSDNSRKKANELCGRLYHEWVAVFIEKYGEKAFHEFYEYIKRNGIINDLHPDNLGYRITGEPVVLDYSGYREDF